MISDQLRIVVLSDIHLGHPNTPTVEIINNLNLAFEDTSEASTIDLLIIAGDTFDRLMHLPDVNVMSIRLWINRMLRFCKKYDIVLRILEGTPSHDWKQSRLWPHLNELAHIGADVEYVETLSIEYIEKFGINILYVPDEWNPECDDTWIEVQQLLRKSALKQVDFTVMHGAFDYQLPVSAGISVHDPIRYRSITQYFVFIGHIHLHSIRDRIIAPGSFDRLAHGEEGPKGYLDLIVRSNGNHDLKFVENTQAKQYVTLVCTNKEVDKTLKFLEKKLNKLPPNSFVRIEAAKSDPIFVSLDTLKKGFPFLRFSTKVSGSNEITTQTLLDLRNNYQPIALNRENIRKLLIERLTYRGTEAEVLKRAEEVLDAHY